MRTRIGIGIGVLAAVFACGGFVAPAFAETHELTLTNGAAWRGDDGDKVKVVYEEQGVQQELIGVLESIQGDRPGFQIVIVRGNIAGKERTKGIFAPDIVSMTTVEAGSGTSDASGGGSPGGNESASITSEGGDATEGVFFMPWSGKVGIGARHDEIEKVAAEADKLGDGQTIVIQIISGGGLVLEGDRIHETLKDVKKRHRVVAWIKEAISAAAFTALHCDEIYFMKNGALGSAVMFAGQTAISGARLAAWVDKFAEVADIGGREPQVARCMVTRTYEVSYDKDPETGKITWYNDLRGEYDISDKNNVLTLNADNAVDCGYADGIAETKEELAALLDMDRWVEVNDSGQKIYDRWQANVEKAQKDLPMLWAQWQYKGTATGDPTVRLGTQIRILEKILAWYDRCYPVCVYEIGMPADPEPLKRQLAEMKKQLADMRRGRR
ncbi:MAG: hypothetical protein MK085_10910 [Phycisphaerales bacterium]|nr:hypothetical protein [Phycisphaerales bacterium]